MEQAKVLLKELARICPEGEEQLLIFKLILLGIEIDEEVKETLKEGFLMRNCSLEPWILEYLNSKSL